MKKIKEFIAIVEELLKMTGVEVSVDVKKTDEAMEVNINSNSETGLLIGYRGENIGALQTILGLVYKQLTGEWMRTVVNVGDYIQRQEEKLQGLADQAVNHVLETGQDQPIYNLTPAQRRTIHMYISQRKDVLTESMGEDPDRYLVIRKK